MGFLLYFSLPLRLFVTQQFLLVYARPLLRLSVTHTLLRAEWHVKSCRYCPQNGSL